MSKQKQNPNVRIVDTFSNRQDAEALVRRLQQPTYTRLYTIEVSSKWRRKETYANGKCTSIRTMIHTYSVVETIGINDKAYVEPTAKKGASNMNRSRLNDEDVEPNKPLVRYWQCDTCKAIIKEGSTPDSKPITIVFQGDRIVNTKQHEESRDTITYHICTTCYGTVLSGLKSMKADERIVK